MAIYVVDNVRTMLAYRSVVRNHSSAASWTRANFANASAVVDCETGMSPYYIGVRFDNGQDGNSPFFARLSNGLLVMTNAFYWDASTGWIHWSWPTSVTYGGGAYRFGQFILDSNENPNDIARLNQLPANVRTELFKGRYVSYLNTKYIAPTSSGTSNMFWTSENAFVWNPANGTAQSAKQAGIGIDDTVYHQFALVPTGAVATISFDKASIGVITSPDGITVTCAEATNADLYLDNDKLGTFSVAKGTSTTVPLAGYWDRVSKNTQHTLKVVTALNGYHCEDKRTFTKRESSLEVLGKPVTTNKMPLACTVLSKTNHAKSEDATMFVCNNGNDSSPDWEEYTEAPHFFANDTKTNANWAVNWRYLVDASGASGSTKPGIVAKVGMGVVYAKGD